MAGNPQSLMTILNRVLQSLRETQIGTGVTTIIDPYQLTLLEFFNQVREEVEDAVNWRSLRQTFTVTVAANTNFINIPGSNERSRLVRVPIKAGGQGGGGYNPSIAPSDVVIPLVFDITQPTTTGQFGLQEMPLDVLIYKTVITNSQTTANPTGFALSMGNPDDSQTGTAEVVLYVYPPPNTPRTIQITLVVPELTYLPTDVARNIYVPTLPIVHGLQWMAREERGEELGPQGIYTEERYRGILDDAVGRENAEQGNTNLDLSLT
jgi:hypothetical protein